MPSSVSVRLCPLLSALVLLASAARAQVPLARPDTLHKYEVPAGRSPAVTTPWYRGKLVKATIVPALLIGYGASTINDHGLYSSYDAKRDLQRYFPGFRRTHADDYLQYVPYLELGAVALAGVDSRDDRINTLLVVLKSELIMTTLVTGIKYSAGVLRPDSSAHNAFPSGHTAQAFLAASIVHAEFRDKSQWYGVGAYTIAASVGALRMLNNKHWESDVFAGAGIGILSAHLAYLSHRNRWGRPPHLLGSVNTMSVSPFYQAGATGLCLVIGLN